MEYGNITVAVRHIELSVGSGKRELRADEAEAARIEYVRPSRHRFGRMKAPCLRIGNTLENTDVVLNISLHLSFRGFHHSCFFIASECNPHNFYPFPAVYIRRLLLIFTWPVPLFLILYHKIIVRKMRVEDRSACKPGQKNRCCAVLEPVAQKRGILLGECTWRVKRCLGHLRIDGKKAQ